MASNSPLLDFDPYEVLNLERHCTDSQIVKAFRRAALRWHPDKNPDCLLRAQEMFLKISKAFELLSDEAARAAYDNVLAAKAARSVYVQRRQQNESEKRRKLREDLEKREANAMTTQQEEEKANRELQKEIERLRREGSRLLERERQNIEREINRPATTIKRLLVARYKLKWKRDKDIYDYDEEDIRALFSKYGRVSDVVISSGTKGMAILEFDQLVNDEGVEKEAGRADLPLTVTCLQKPPTALKSVVPERHPDSFGERPMTSVEFADFEAEILGAMMAGSKRKADCGTSKFDDL
ncbi:unnamed protein product [Thelazia callipaeda]|uniref:J domain-containing protein n=1 Tax=Thelazia callipaeda TaxID=103827 RepID=A0A0N5CR12_THECL|nr:unnamed protein product [Thelazia callipaeda]